MLASTSYKLIHDGIEFASSYLWVSWYSCMTSAERASLVGWGSECPNPESQWRRGTSACIYLCIIYCYWWRNLWVYFIHTSCTIVNNLFLFAWGEDACVCNLCVCVFLCVIYVFSYICQRVRLYLTYVFFVLYSCAWLGCLYCLQHLLITSIFQCFLFHRPFGTICSIQCSIPSYKQGSKWKFWYGDMLDK